MPGSPSSPRSPRGSSLRRASPSRSFPSSSRGSSLRGRAQESGLLRRGRDGDPRPRARPAARARRALVRGGRPLPRARQSVAPARRGRNGVFLACGFAWVGYAAWTLRRALGGQPGVASPVSRQFDVATLTLFCILAPALADLIPRIGAPASAGVSEALEGWRGGNWPPAPAPLLCGVSRALVSAFASGRGD